MSSPLRFSVIIPLEFHRGQAVRCVQAWAQGQLFPREQFEIVVATPAGYPTAELYEIRGLLRAQDRVLHFDRHHDMDLCAKAAESAKGEVLLFTESHCLPEPGTLAGADAATRENPEWAGFSGRSIPITGNFLSEIEADWYGPEIEFGMKEHPWRKVLDQCFVVRRSAYFQAGGFDPAFGHFAEWLLAARLHAVGLKIGYAPTVRIHHVYIGNFSEWHRFTADFVRGQMAYLTLEPGDPLATMFDEVPEWSRRNDLQRSVARRVCRMLVRDLRQSIVVGNAQSPRAGLSSLRRWHWRLLRSWLVRAAAGDSVVLMRAQRRRLTTRAALQLDLVTRSRAHGKDHLGRCCEAIATVERTRFLRRRARDLERDPVRSPHVRLPSAVSGLWEPGRLDAAHGVGFHAASAADAVAIRWSEPAAYVELPLAAGRYVIRLSYVLPPQAGRELRLNFYLDERLIPAEDVTIRTGSIELRVDVREPSSPTRLGWVRSTNLVDDADPWFGVPLVSVAWTRDDAGTNHVDEPAMDEVELAHPG